MRAFWALLLIPILSGCASVNPYQEHNAWAPQASRPGADKTVQDRIDEFESQLDQEFPREKNTPPPRP